MNFTRSTRLSNVPVNAKYNFVFPRYSTKEFKLVGYKNNPSDVIKWGMGVGNDYLDPIWYGSENYIIDGDKVYINDSKLYLSASPVNLSGTGYVELELESKVFSGDISVAFGFPSDNYKTTGFDRWNPHDVTTDYNYTCGYEFDYTLTPEKRAWCYYYDEVNETNIVVFNHTFDSGSIATKTVYWSEVVESDWSKINVDTTKIMFEFEGVNTWRVAKNLPIVKDNNYKARVKIEVPLYDHDYEKYWICLMPSSYGRNISAASAAEHLYCLDPGVAPNITNSILYYTFDNDDYSAPIVNDTTTNEFDANNTGLATTNETGILEEAFDFDGINDYLILPKDSGIINQEMTWCMWISRDTYNTRDYFWAKNHDTGYQKDVVYILETDDTINWWWGKTSSSFNLIASATAILNDDWNFVCGTRNSTNASLYINSSLDQSDGYSGYYVSGGDYLTIAGYEGMGGDVDRRFDGMIDEVSFFDTVLTVDEISYLYNSGAPTTAQQYPFVEHYIFNGTVEYGNGTMVDGAHVFIFNQNTNTSVGDTITDENGTWTYDNGLLTGNFSVRAITDTVGDGGGYNPWIELT